jgi:hypothetical protein
VERRGGEGQGRGEEERGERGEGRERKGRRREGRGGEEGTGRGVPILLFLQIEHCLLIDP